MMQQRRSGLWFTIVCFIFAAYLLNLGLSFIPLPAAVQSIEKWIIIVAGGLLVFAGINYMRLVRYLNQYGRI